MVICNEGGLARQHLVHQAAQTPQVRPVHGDDDGDYDDCFCMTMMTTLTMTTMETKIILIMVMDVWTIIHVSDSRSLIF